MADDFGRVVAAATDGACSGNPGPGGWAALMRFENGTVEEFGGFEPMTTNNRMELQAALSLLKRLKELPRHPDLVIRSDSKYLIDGLLKWLPGWKRKGWRTAAGKSVLNQDLWQALDQAQLEDVPITYVKGHSGDPDNDRVDQIAVSYSKGQQPALRITEKTFGTESGESQEIKEILEKVDIAPLELHRLISRLDLVDQIAKKGYSLSSSELSKLIDQSMSKIQKYTTTWLWRDWWVQPLGNGRWRILKNSKKLDEFPEILDG